MSILYPLSVVLFAFSPVLWHACLAGCQALAQLGRRAIATP